jgi:hydrogenase/urease accessory protein HupE
MRRFLISLFWTFVFVAIVKFAYAEDAAPAKEAATHTSSFIKDLGKARETLLGTAGDSPFGRGFMVALFQPVFLSSMFCIGLWAGQLSERLKAIWALPLLVFGATVIGSFITTYHADWKPDFDPEKYKFLSQFKSTDAVAVAVGLMAGVAVGMQLVVAPFFAIIIAIVAGLALGFSQTTEFGDHKNALLPFWTGFGLMGLLVNIFGIGFETFLQSINLTAVTRCVGFATLALSFFFGTKVF